MTSRVESKSSELVSIFHEQSGWNLARVKFFVLMISALCKVQTVGFEKLATAFDCNASTSSSLRRIQRFMSAYLLDTDLIARLIFRLYAEMEVMYGQTGHLFLFDGTEVWLNSGTKFKYPNKFNQNERNVFMEGEAYFKVAPNKHLPFKVKTGKLEVEVLGTSFNLSAYPSEPTQSVFLDEGKVQINDMVGHKIGDIIPGQIAVKTDGNSSIQVQNADSYFYTSWKDGKITFSSEKLSDIAKKMERWYNVEIRFSQESLKDYNFSGTILRAKPIDQTIMAMEQLAPIRFQYQVRPNEKNLITIMSK